MEQFLFYNVVNNFSLSLLLYKISFLVIFNIDDFVTFIISLSIEILIKWNLVLGMFVS